jgi:hypothetical protein
MGPLADGTACRRIAIMPPDRATPTAPPSERKKAAVFADRQAMPALTSNQPRVNTPAPTIGSIVK